MSLLEVMRALYASEINCSISSFWDGGWIVRLGDRVNGWTAAAEFDDDELEAAAIWLDGEARARFPGSQYAWLGHIPVQSNPPDPETKGWR